MAIKLMTKVSLLLLVQLLVPRVDAGSWQSCREVSVAKCGVGDSSRDGHEYRYDIGAYRYKWTKYPNEAISYKGPFRTITLNQAFQSCLVCSNETGPTQGGPPQNPPPPPFRKNIMIVDNNVGKIDTEKAELLSQIPCGRDCRLWFVGCNLTAIEGGAFAELPQVSTLVIWRSNVQTLRNSTFAGMDGLKRLLLLENNLTHLEDGCFGGLPSLSDIILVDNQILTLSPDTFQGVQPWWFDVSANRISNVAPGTLQAVTSVEYIRAAENKLRAIGAGMFHGLERLNFLILEGNRISHIAAGAFHSNTKLSHVNLAGNRLTFLSGSWFQSKIPSSLFVRGNGIAAIALEGRVLTRWKRMALDNPPRCTCANDWLYESSGKDPKFKQPFKFALKVPQAAGCPASALMRTLPAPVPPSGTLRCPPPLLEVLNVEYNAAYTYKAAGSVYWEQLPQVSCTLFPNDSQHSVDITYDKNTTTHASLPTGNLTVRVVTDLKAEGWVKCEGPDSLLGESGNHSLCYNYMGKSSFTVWIETAQPLSFGNTTCTASSETGSHTAVFMASERAHSGMITPQATELPLITTTPFTTGFSTTPLPTGSSTTPLSISATDDGSDDLTWYIVWAAIGLLSPIAAVGVWMCANCIRRRLKRKAPGNDAGPSRDGNQIIACSAWPLEDDSVISPYAEGRFEDHESLKDTKSVISPYAEAGFADHPDLCKADSSQSEIVPYGLAKLCAAYAGRARAQTHPVPSHPYSAERPRQKPNREGAVVASYVSNGRNDSKGGKSGPTCYQHPSILPNPGATQSSVYQQDVRAAQGSRKAPCYNSPALATDQERTLSSTYDQRDPREAVQGSRKAPCYNSPALATDQERTLSSTYDQNDPREAAKGSRKAPCYNTPALATDQKRTLSKTYDQHDPRKAAQGSRKAPCYNSPALATDQEQTLSSTYDQNDPSDSTKESPVANSYEPAALPNSETGTQSAIYDDRRRGNANIGRGDRYICPSPATGADRSPAAAYSQNDRREAINDTPESPETNSYEPAPTDGIGQ